MRTLSPESGLAPRLVLVLVCLAFQASAGEWRLDREHSALSFYPRWEGAELDGRFQRFGADIVFDPRHPEAARFQVRVDVTSADLGSADADRELAAPEWFFTQRFPRAIFTSREVRSLGKDRFLVRGVLRLKGVSRPVRVPIFWRERDGRARLEAEFIIGRSDFGIGTGDWASGEEVGLEVRVHASLLLLPVP